MKRLFFVLIAFALFAAFVVTTKDTSRGKVKSKIGKETPSVSVNSDTLFTFENYELNSLPNDWSQAVTGKKQSTDWKIIEEKNNNKVLAQLSNNNPGYHFNLAVYNLIEAKNVILEVKIKGVSGNIDRGGGFVWRYKDRNNYYVVRENPLEDNVVLYKVVNGIRTDLPLLGKGRTYGVSVPKLGSGWNKLKLVAQDEIFTVYLNGKELFKVKDKTFTGKGKFGFWTKADAVSYFDDFHVSLID